MTTAEVDPAVRPSEVDSTAGPSELDSTAGPSELDSSAPPSASSTSVEADGAHPNASAAEPGTPGLAPRALDSVPAVDMAPSTWTDAKERLEPPAAAAPSTSRVAPQPVGMAAGVPAPGARVLGAGSAHTRPAQEAEPAEQPSPLSASSAREAPAASSGSGGVGVPALPVVVLLTVLLHWSRLALPKVRWWPPVFLALPERPG